MLDPEPSHLLCHDVEFVGLAARADLNGQQGVTFSFDAAKGRYGVLVKGERVSVKSNNLRLYEHPPLTDVALRRAREDPFTYYIVSPKIGCQMRHCANFKCGALGIVMGASSLKEAHNLSYKLLQTCSICHEAVYCSRDCQKKHWEFHKLVCDAGKDMHKIYKFFSKDQEANGLLCGYADEDANGMHKRRMIHFVCPDSATLKNLHNKEAWFRGIPVDIQFTPVADMKIQLSAMAKQSGDSSIWQTALNQVESYSLKSHIAIAVSAPDLDGEFLVRPMLVPRLDVS